MVEEAGAAAQPESIRSVNIIHIEMILFIKIL